MKVIVSHQNADVNKKSATIFQDAAMKLLETLSIELDTLN
jgi:hypothetical protein